MVSGASPELGEEEQPLTEEARRAAEARVRQNAQALDLLHRAADLSCSPHDFALTPNPGAILPVLSRFRAAAGLLQTEAVLRVEQGDAAGAAQAIRACLRLGDSLADTPVVLAQLNRMACHGCAVDALTRALNRGIRFTDAQVAELAEALTESQRRSELSIARAIAGERILYSSQAPYWLRRWNGNDMARMALAAAEPTPLRLARLEAVVAPQARNRFTLRMASMVAPALARFAEGDLAALAKLRAARTALAIERYRTANGEPPAALDALVPAYLEAVPADPFTGTPLLYKRLDTGYVVYSVGVDRRNDGGDLRRLDPHRLDEGLEVRR